MGVRKVPVREIEEADCAEMGQGQVILFTSFFSSDNFDLSVKKSSFVTFFFCTVKSNQNYSVKFSVHKNLPGK